MNSSQPPQQLALLSVSGLLPCPFCGMAKLARVTRTPPEGEPEPICIQCETCGATGPTATTHEHLRVLWDIRANTGRTA